MGKPKGYHNKEKIVCQKCGRPQWDQQYYFMKKDGTRYPICKDCITANIDNRDPNTFLWILKEFDVPYVETLWNQIFNKQYMKDPAKFNGKSVLGMYLRSMRVSQYKDYGFEDTGKFKDNRDKAAEEISKKTGMTVEEYEEDLRKKLMNGEISQAEYNTLSPTKSVFMRDDSVVTHPTKFTVIEPPKENVPQTTNMSIANGSSFETVPSTHQLQPTMTTNPALGPIPDVVGVNESKIQSELTPDDIQYLSLKWGIHYKPSEWVALEDLFQKYAAEYDLSIDREQVLKNICRTSLKMDQALDVGDIKSYRDLAAVFEQMRKSGKFTEAQVKEEEVKRDIDSIGELVAFVEQEGGTIPAYKNPIDYPQDKVDFCIKDIKNYVDNLVKEDLGLSGLIESYLMKADNNKAQSVDDIISNSFKTKEELDIEDMDRKKTFEELFEEEAMRVFSMPYYERSPYASM